MMHSRTIAAATILSMLALGACDDIEGLDDDLGTNASTAQIRFVNVTGNSLSFAQNGTVGTGMGNLAFGTSTSCATVNTATPSLSVVSNGVSTSLSGLTANLTSNGTYTILAYPGTGGTTAYTILPTTFSTTSGQAGLRVFNATGTAFDVYTAGSGGAFTTASATGIVGGTASNFFNVAAGTGGQIRFNNAGTTTSALTLSNQNFTAGQNAILVIAPPATGTTTYRTFLVTGC
jgi:hypothetical protein